MLCFAQIAVEWVQPKIGTSMEEIVFYKVGLRRQWVRLHSLGSRYDATCRSPNPVWLISQTTKLMICSNTILKILDCQCIMHVTQSRLHALHPLRLSSNANLLETNFGHIFAASLNSHGILADTQRVW